MRLPPVVAGALALMMTAAGVVAQDSKAPSHHGIAIHGDVKYPPDFKHFAYVNPDAPKGGLVRLATVGTFDSFNPYTLKGVPAAGLNGVYELLMMGSLDEASAEYGVIVESVQVPEDRSWVAFTLRKEARWNDGRPVTPDDVTFSLDILKTKGHPFWRAYFHNLQKAEKVGERTVRIAFEGGINRELPVIASANAPARCAKLGSSRAAKGPAPRGISTARGVSSVGIATSTGSVFRAACQSVQS